ncbi:hypothetical protein MUGA111182_20425 [Mucilaginibacter galii]|uniref:Tetratricopeptide repeat protein n=1 Tax=Mucilaginibacter galii TaxID=2005073 RepID=A0A917N2W5_9SPHI|nr:hypothetical protein [Mucilaginibacter galii]GGI52505.1 hypothetical protein GCM10011425_37170 [Mucilaginibacter galii]
MNNYDLLKLFEEYEEAYSGNPNDIIAFIEKKKDLLHQISELDEVESFKKFAALVATYIKTLVDTGIYNKAIDEALLFLPVIEKNMIFLSIDPSQEHWYLTLCFQKAYAHYQLKDYHFALKHFRQLLTYTPDSDQLKAWADYAWYGTLKGYMNAMLIVASVLTIGSVCLKNVLPPLVRFTIAITGLILIGVHTWVGYRIKKNRRAKT